MLLVKPCPSEAARYQKAALAEAVGSDGRRDVLMVCSDAPAVLCPHVGDLFPRVKCVSKDPLHIAMKVESAFNEHRSGLSTLLRRCLCKFIQKGDDEKTHFRGQRAPVTLTPLQDVIDNMTERRAELLKQKIQGDRLERRRRRCTRSGAAVAGSFARLFQRR